MVTRQRKTGHVNVVIVTSFTDDRQAASFAVVISAFGATLRDIT